MTEEEVRELECVLLDYVERFGLTPKAREYFIRKTQEGGSKQTVMDVSCVKGTQ